MALKWQLRGLHVRRHATTPRGSGAARLGPASFGQTCTQVAVVPWDQEPLIWIGGESMEAPGRGRWTRLGKEGNLWTLRKTRQK